MTSILAKHRIAALVGVALIATPLVASAMITNPAATPVVATTTNGLTSFAPIVTADKPAVVTITTKMKAANVEFDGNSPFGGNSPFDEQFRQFFGQQGIPMPQPKQQPVAQALGSGFIIDPNGTIVTNNHVIDGAVDIKVTLDDGTELPAKLIGADPKSDLAVLKISASRQLPTVKWGDSDHMNAGDPVLAIGNPFGLGTTVTSGIVSARGRDLNNGPYDDFIQVDAAINHGNSGGPLMNSQGEVVGINTAIYSPNGGNVGVGFAIPSNEAKSIVAKLIEHGSIQHGVMGVVIQPVTKDIADAIGLKDSQGALVAKVNPDSAAAKAGVKSGDVILSLDGKTIKTTKDLSRFVADITPGTREQMTLWRNGESKDLSITIGGDKTSTQTAENDDQNSGSAESAKHMPSIGIGLGDLNNDARQALNLPADEHGAVVESVNPDKPAAAAGIQTGDVIVAVNQKPVANAREARNAVVAAAKAGRKSVLLLVERSGGQTFIAVPFGNA
jgi:serine protease Do